MLPPVPPALDVATLVAALVGAIVGTSAVAALDELLGAEVGGTGLAGRAVGTTVGNGPVKNG